MKFSRLFFWILLATVALSACGAPAAAPVTPAPVKPPVVTDLPAVSTPETAAATPAPIATATTVQPLPQATSRGDQLAASDPASVKLGAGRPVLVEFFRFT
jgi:hypothetical protein